MTPEEKEALRRAVRAHLAERIGISQSAATIDSRLRREHRCKVADIAEAADFLVDLGHLSVTPDPLGATRYYQATAAGVLAHERGL